MSRNRRVRLIPRHPDPERELLFDKCLHRAHTMRNNPDMNRRFFSEESKKKLWRPCREARALGL